MTQVSQPQAIFTEYGFPFLLPPSIEKSLFSFKSSSHGKLSYPHGTVCAGTMLSDPTLVVTIVTIVTKSMRQTVLQVDSKLT